MTADSDRIDELEIRLAFQDELLQSLNDTVAQMRRTLDLQQAQLQLLYRRTETAAGHERLGTADEVPPHY